MPRSRYKRYANHYYRLIQIVIIPNCIAITRRHVVVVVIWPDTPSRRQTTRVFRSALQGSKEISSVCGSSLFPIRTTQALLELLFCCFAQTGHFPYTLLYLISQQCLSILRPIPRGTSPSGTICGHMISVTTYDWLPVEEFFVCPIQMCPHLTD